MDRGSVNRADRFAGRRAAVAIVMAVVLTVTQGARMSDSGVSLAAWLVWGVLVVAFLVWAAGLLSGRDVRALADDEPSDHNRRSSLSVGFWAMIGSALICLLLTIVKDYPAQDALQVVLTTGLVAALLSFGVAERRALQP